ncbi:MAG: glycosyltransferase family 2 protein [Candidatus Kerfeldbacteria bacterium]|nr:glycosyltransferase family 2 protein [Candidatus Kerfeldbacteria bacterium]
MMHPLRLTVQVVTWNSAETLPLLLRSLRNQSFAQFHLVILDNASQDGSADIARRGFPGATVIRNSENRGFCAAHNQGIRIAETDYIALLNPDVLLMQDALGLLVEHLSRTPSIGSIGGKLIRQEHGITSIDSAGLLARPTRQFLNRGEGEQDRGQLNDVQKVFGLTGAFVMFRRSALESIRIGSEYLDEDLFAYKDDVDCAWRLLLAGWENVYFPRAVGVHSRHARHETEYSTRTRRKRKHPTINRLSYRNHLLMLLKNEEVRNFFFPLPRLLFYEVLKLGYLMLFEQRTLLGLVEALRLFPVMLRKRRITLAHRKRSSRSMRAFFQT